MSLHCNAIFVYGVSVVLGVVALAFPVAIALGRAIEHHDALAISTECVIAQQPTDTKGLEGREQSSGRQNKQLLPLTDKGLDITKKFGKMREKGHNSHLLDTR